MIRAIFFDVDGTLVSFRTHRVADSAREALRRVGERGVRLYVATGRDADDLEVLDGIPFDGVVSLNGARCVASNGRTVASHPIRREDFELALHLSDRLDFPLALELEGGIFVNRITPDVERVAQLVAHPTPRRTDLRELFDRVECCQMCFYVDPVRERRIMDSFPDLVANRWHPLFADINVRGVDKATGMAAFAACDGFELSQAMAFGDGGNDVPMLRAAGTGVAMGNACPQAKAASDYVTGDIDCDGVRDALAHFGVIG